MKRLFAILLAVGFCIIAVSFVVSRRQDGQRAAQRAAWEKMKAERAADWDRASAPPQPRTTPVAPIEPERPSLSLVQNTGTSTSAPSSEPVKSVPPSIAKAPSSTSTLPFQQPLPGKKEWQDPLAREALSYVGADPEAEEVWADAINNPDLPPNERKDLIEDLNEDGFPDPKNITEEDLPLILSRLRLIEAHGPYALDDVNAAAFGEAYKDLVQMYLRLAGR